MTGKKVLKLLDQLGWNETPKFLFLLLFHIGLGLGVVAMAAGYARPTYGLAPRQPISATTSHFAYELEPTNPAGVDIVVLPDNDRLLVVWIGGSPLNIGPAGGPSENLGALVFQDLALHTDAEIDLVTVQLQASGFGDVFVVAHAMIEREPDLIIVEANAVWFGNDLVTNRYPYLASELPDRLMSTPSLWPLAFGSKNPGGYLVDAATSLAPPLESFRSSTVFSSNLATRLDVINTQQEHPTEAGPPPAEGLPSFWQRGTQDVGLFWTEIGIKWRGRDESERLRDDDQISNALFVELLDAAQEHGVAVFSYVNPVNFTAEEIPQVRYKELVLLSLEDRANTPGFATPSQFLNERLPGVTFRDPNHVNHPGQLPRVLASDLCEVLHDAHPNIVACSDG